MRSAQSSTAAPAIVGQRYQLLCRIGEDLPVETWEAYDARLDRTVLLRLAAGPERDDPSVQAQLRRAARGRVLGTGPDAPRILDGGEDPMYGPFVVAELNRAFEATEPLTVITTPVPSQAAGRVPPSRSEKTVAPERQNHRAGLLALLALLLVSVATLAFLGRALAPSDRATAPSRATPSVAEPRGPRVGAPLAEPTLEPTTSPALGRSAPGERATPQPTVTPADVAAALSPVDTIRQHYALITARRYAEGYRLMDARLRSLNSPADYASWFANKISVTPVSIELVSQNEQQAVVRSLVQSIDRVNGQDVTSQVSEQFVMRYEDGAWRIDQVSGS